MKKHISIVILIALAIVLTGCNIKPQDFTGYFEQSIVDAKESNYCTHFELVEHTERESTGSITGSIEYSKEKTAYIVVHKDGEYYAKEVKGDTTIERWVYKKDARPMLTVKKNGIIIEDRELIEGQDSINLIADLFADYSALNGKDILQIQGIKRLGFDMLKVKSESVELIRENQEYKKKIGKGKNEEYKYNWDNIKSAEKRTINLTIKSDKIDILEAVVEYVEQRKTPPGQIATTDKYIGVIVRRLQVEAHLQYGDFPIPSR